MNKEKSYKYKVGSDGSRGYLITAHKKEHKCIMCGAMSKLGNFRSFNKKNFICSDCLESFIRQYFKSKKTISLSKFIKNKVAWKKKLNKASDIKWYNSGSSISQSIPCGTKINGGPKVKIIFNATFSNRKKF